MTAANKPLHILVTDAHKLAGLGAVRSLGRAGHRVIAGYPQGEEQPAGAWSRYWSSELRYPSPRLHHFEFRNWLFDLASRGTIDGILPVVESSIVGVASVRRELPSGFLTILPGDSALEYTLSKYRSTEKALSLGIPCPPTLFISDGTPPKEWNRNLSSLRFPVIIKTDNYLTPEGTYEPGRNFIAADTDAAKRILCGLELKPTRIIAQEVIPGDGTGAFLLRFGGKTCLRFAHRRLHEVPYTGGVSSFRESIHDDELVSLGEALLNAIDYDGVAMVEFRRSAVDGKPYFLEINGRLWGSLALALHCGVDFPKSLVECYQNGAPTTKTSNYRSGIKCRNIFTGELVHLLSILTARPTKGLDRTPSKFRAVAKFFALTLNPTVRHDYFWWSDPLPGIVQATRIVSRTTHKIIKKTVDKVQDYGDAKTLKQLKAEHQIRSTQPRYFERPPKKVMFVCYGNICRSPFAEHLWNAKIQEHSLNGNICVSAGCHPQEGRTTPNWALDLAAEHGVDLAKHRSRVLTKMMVESADAIFVMDRKNYRALTVQFPWAKQKTYFLGLFADDSWIEIDDPYGMSIDDAHNCYQRIALSLDGLMKRILPNEMSFPAGCVESLSSEEQHGRYSTLG
jgi:protein-tyrosine-phosphatase/predicted ATP-grasp superfamily ATP-dependent carboligase